MIIEGEYNLLISLSVQVAFDSCYSIEVVDLHVLHVGNHVYVISHIDCRVCLVKLFGIYANPNVKVRVLTSVKLLASHPTNVRRVRIVAEILNLIEPSKYVL